MSATSDAFPPCDGPHLMPVHSCGTISDNVNKSTAMWTQVWLSPAGHLQFANCHSTQQTENKREDGRSKLCIIVDNISSTGNLQINDATSSVLREIWWS